MIVLLGAVLVLMQVARRPEIWSTLLFLDNRGAARESTNQNNETASAQPAPDSSLQRFNTLTMGAFVLLAIAYCAWRTTRLVRSLSRRPANREPRLLGRQRPRGEFLNKSRPTTSNEPPPAPSPDQTAPLDR
jgi:hypothetical protein